MIRERPHSVAIVGAGPGGLASAILLAASGVRVRIYEAQPVIGGRTARLESGGFRFDRGPTFFLMPYVLDEIFASAGRRLADVADLRRLDPMYRLVIGNPSSDRPWVVDATQDISAMRARLGAIHGADGEAFGRFIEHNRAKLAAAEPILRKAIRSPLDLMDGASLRAARYINPHLSVHQLLERYFEHPAVRLAVSFQSKYLGMSPYDCPSLFTILPFIEYEFGVWHPIGGCNALMDAMAGVARALGVEIMTGAPVERIAFQGRRATGVVVGGELHEHAHVVINADAAWAIKNLIPSDLRPRLTDRFMDSRKYSCSTYMMYLGVDGVVDLPHHTIYVSSKYRQNLDDISVHGRLSEDPSVYVCNPSVTDQSMAPPGSSSLYVLAPTPNCRSGVDWGASDGEMRERVLEQVEKRLGIRDIRERIRVEHRFTPADWRGTNINFGATFNLAHNLGQMLHNRPHHRLQDVDGVWMVGGGTHPGSGLPVIFLSAQITSRLLAREMGVAYAGDRVPATPIRRTASEAIAGAGCVPVGAG